MSRDGYLPDNVSEADFDRAFPPDCPDECASMQEEKNAAMLCASPSPLWIGRRIPSEMPKLR